MPKSFSSSSIGTYLPLGEILGYIHLPVICSISKGINFIHSFQNFKSMGQARDPRIVVAAAVAYVDSFLKVHGCNGGNCLFAEAKWCPPHRHAIKVNTDATVNSDNKVWVWVVFFGTVTGLCRPH